MPSERYYSSKNFIEGDVIFFEEQEFHHLIHVMRTRAGEEVEIVNGNGQLAVAIVKSLEKKRAVIEIANVLTAKPEQYPLILAQSIPRTNRLEYILEKATELGATEIWLFNSTNSEKRVFTDHQKERLDTILIAAMKQCGRLFLPKLKFSKSMEEIFPLKDSIKAYFGSTNPLAPPFFDILNEQSARKGGSLFCVGPEGGFTDEEDHFMVLSGLIGVKLHSNILRTDTAAIAGLSIISSKELSK